MEEKEEEEEEKDEKDEEEEEEEEEVTKDESRIKSRDSVLGCPNFK